MTKVLMIPSWYPTPENFLRGIFFEEQVKFLCSQGLDCRVLYQEREFIPNLSFMKNPIFTMANDFRKIDLEPPTYYRKQYVLRGLPEYLKLRLLYSGYLKGWRGVTEDGWFPDQLLAFSMQDAGLAAKELALQFNLPYKIIEHNPIDLTSFSSYRRALLIEVMEKASAFGVVSRSLGENILSQGVNVSPKIIWNFIDEEKFPLIRPSISQMFNIVTVSYPMPVKDMDTFFKSISYLRSNTKDSFLVTVVGSDNFGSNSSAPTKKIEWLADKHGVHDCCRFIPCLTRPEIAALMASANVFVSSSRTETFGVAIREAMMTGVPTISTKNGGAEDTIDGTNGILVSVGDYVAIAENILAFLNKSLTLDANNMRQSVICQSGREAFLKAMTNFID